MKKALITGITGQDGAYLARRLLEAGYEVHGGVRRSASRSTWRLAELGIEDRVSLVPLDLLELTNILRVIQEIRPDEVYNLAAQSFVATSFEQPLYTGDVVAMGPMRLLETIRAVDPGIRFYQASSSEMFGQVVETPQRETTRFHPRSPYGVAKAFAHYATQNYRESFGMHAVAGILFNHESPLRGLEFVTRKITATLARIKAGERTTLELGNLEARRDWGFAGDYVEAMHLMVTADTPRDYVVATGETRSVREFLLAAAEALDLALEWEGEGAAERAVERGTGRPVFAVNPRFYRPAEVETLTGDPAAIARELGWRPRHGFHDLVRLMARADYDRVKAGRAVF